MANHRLLIPFILHWEGGFVDDPHDRGGATNKGITMATWRDYCKDKDIHPSVETLKNITDEQWKDIYKHNYWDVAHADEITDQSVANLIVDWLWCSGRVSIRHTQKIVGCKADGIVGPKTLAAINGQSPLTLFGMLHKDRGRYLHRIVSNRPSQNRFLRGWLNRLNAIQYDHLNLE